jgi:hypothetical protein
MGSTSNSSGRGRRSAGADEHEDTEQDDENGYEVYTIYYAIHYYQKAWQACASRLAQQSSFSMCRDVPATRSTIALAGKRSCTVTCIHVCSNCLNSVVMVGHTDEPLTTLLARFLIYPHACIHCSRSACHKAQWQLLVLSAA